MFSWGHDDRIFIPPFSFHFKGGWVGQPFPPLGGLKISLRVFQPSNSRALFLTIVFVWKVTRSFEVVCVSVFRIFWRMKVSDTFDFAVGNP